MAPESAKNGGGDVNFSGQQELDRCSSPAETLEVVRRWLLFTNFWCMLSSGNETEAKIMKEDTACSRLGMREEDTWAREKEREMVAPGWPRRPFKKKKTLQISNGHVAPPDWLFWIFPYPTF